MLSLLRSPKWRTLCLIGHNRLTHIHSYLVKKNLLAFDLKFFSVRHCQKDFLKPILFKGRYITSAGQMRWNHPGIISKCVLGFILWTLPTCFFSWFPSFSFCLCFYFGDSSKKWMNALCCSCGDSGGMWIVQWSEGKVQPRIWLSFIHPAGGWSPVCFWDWVLPTRRSIVTPAELISIWSCNLDFVFTHFIWK